MKVAIAWYGAEGQASYNYYVAKGNDVTIVTPQFSPDFMPPQGAKTITGPDAFEHLNGFDLVIRSAGTRPDSLNTDGKVWSATNEFFAKCPAPIIGVTGTKGKGTTSSLIASILRAAGKTVHLVGNIGVPPLELLDEIKADDIVVFEMSSFQLWDLEKSPHVAVVLMIEPDHLDIHSDMNEYVAAKARIRQNQVSGDICVYHPTNEFSKRIAFSSDISAPMRYGVANDGACYVKDDMFYIRDQAICRTSELQLVGQHNVDNACAAISAAWEYTQDKGAIIKGIHAFEGLPHRTKFIRELDGVKYYDDNYSSAPGAAIAAMRSFTVPEVLIMGGYDRQIDFSELAEAICSQPNIKKVILIGQTRDKIAAALDALGRSGMYELSGETTLRPIVESARSIAQPGDVVIMSPACASFDMFRNFGDRGDQFIEIVESF